MQAGEYSATQAKYFVKLAQMQLEMYDLNKKYAFPLGQWYNEMVTLPSEVNLFP